MKTRNWANWIIVAAVIGCSAVLLIALSSAMGGLRLSHADRLLLIDFEDTAGVAEGSSVAYAGRPVGRVIAIRVLTRAERESLEDPSFAVRMTVALDADAPELASDVKVGVGMDSFLGKTFVAIHPGSVGADPLPNGAVLKAEDKGLLVSIEGIEERVRTLLDKMDRDYSDLLPKIRSFVERGGDLFINLSNVMADLTATSADVRELTAEIHGDYQHSFRQRIEGILGQIQQVTTNANVSLDQLRENGNRALEGASKLLEPDQGDLAAILADLRVISQNLKVATTYAKAFTAEIGERPSRVIFSRKRRKPLPRESEILGTNQPVLLDEGR